MDFGYGLFLGGNSIFLMWREVLAIFILGVAVFAAGAYRFSKVFC
jgi:hypothetical protein